MSAKATPQSYEGIVDLITRDYAGLSPGYQQIARFFTQNPNTIALESINAIAQKCGVHPSSLVRFAQNMGYSGFKQLQGVFQTRLATAAPGFRERISALDAETVAPCAGRSQGPAARDSLCATSRRCRGLMENVTEEALGSAAKLIAQAETVYIAGQLRSEPIALLLRYLLTMLQRGWYCSIRREGWRRRWRRPWASQRRAHRHRLPALCQGGGGDRRPRAGERNAPGGDHRQRAVASCTACAGAVHRAGRRIQLLALACRTHVLAQSLATVTAAVLQPGSGGALRIPSVTEIAQDEGARLPRMSKAGGGDGNRTCIPNNDAIEVSFQNHAEPGGPAMPTIRLTMAQALVRYLCNQFTIIDGRRSRCSPGSSASSVMATSPACRKRWRLCRTSCHLARAERAVHGTRCHRLCEGDAAAADHGSAVLDRAGCPQHGDGGGLRPCQPAARPVPCGRHLRQPAA